MGECFQKWCSLKTGSIMIGVVGVIGSILTILRFSLGTYSIGHSWLTVAAIIYGIVELLMHLFLIYGATAERLKLMKTYIVYSIVRLAIVELLCVAGGIFLLYMVPSILIFLLIMGLLASVFCSFWILIIVVNGFHDQLTSRDNQKNEQQYSVYGV